MLPGIRIYELKKVPDERGIFAELFRMDWKELLNDDNIVQTNLSVSYPGIIRAWHRHNRGQVDYFIVIKGTMKICAYDDGEKSETRGELNQIIASSDKLQVVRIPGFYWHGTKTIGNEQSLTVYFPTRLFDHRNPDEERRPWNDPGIIDSKSGQPFDWNKPPYK